MADKDSYKLSPEQVADMEASSYYQELEKYIDESNGRFFFGRDDKSGLNFFNELDNLLPKLKILHCQGETYYRARIVKCRTGHLSLGQGKFDAYSESEFAAPPSSTANDGRINPRGISYLYLADSRRCALSEIRPNISSLVAIAQGTLHKNLVVTSFVHNSWPDISLSEKSMVDLIGWIFSRPLNNLDAIEYLPSQVIAEYIRNAGFDGIEYRSSQYRTGINLALFDTNTWSAESATTFEVEDISYTAVRERGLVDFFGYPDEEL